MKKFCTDLSMPEYLAAVSVPVPIPMSASERWRAPSLAKPAGIRRRLALLSGAMPLRSKRSRVRVAPGPLRKIFPRFTLRVGGGSICTTGLWICANVPAHYCGSRPGAAEGHDDPAGNSGGELLV